MTQRQYRTLSKRIVDSLPADGKDTVYWDRELPGFGLRVYATGRKVFVVQTRAFGRSKRVTLGEHMELAVAARVRMFLRQRAGDQRQRPAGRGLCRDSHRRTGRPAADLETGA